MENCFVLFPSYSPIGEKSERKERRKKKRRVESATKSNFGIATVFATRSKVFIAFSRLHMPATLPTVMNTNSKKLFSCKISKISHLGYVSFYVSSVESQPKSFTIQ